MIKHFDWLAILALLAASIVSLSKALEDPQNTSIVVDPIAVDFGIVEPGERLTASVYIKNVSDRKLTIHRHLAGCSCTGTLIENPSIAPGKFAVLKVTFRSPKTKRGRINSSILLDWSLEGEEERTKTNVTLDAMVQ